MFKRSLQYLKSNFFKATFPYTLAESLSETKVFLKALFKNMKDMDHVFTAVHLFWHNLMINFQVIFSFFFAPLQPFSQSFL